MLWWYLSKYTVALYLTTILSIVFYLSISIFNRTYLLLLKYVKSQNTKYLHLSNVHLCTYKFWTNTLVKVFCNILSLTWYLIHLIYKSSERTSAMKQMIFKNSIKYKKKHSVMNKTLSMFGAYHHF